MRDFIQYLYDTGLGARLDLVNSYLCFAMEICVGQWLAKKLKIKWWAALILTFVRFFAAGTIASLIYQLHNNFNAVGGGFLTMAYVYVPLVLAPIYLLMRVHWKTACDYLAITLAVFQWPIHIGCIFKSCCNGYESSFGIWNAYKGHYTFPIQIVNCVTGLCIALFLIYLLSKNGFKPTGRLYPILLILHGVERLGLDFARDTRKDLLGLTYAQLHATFMILVGAVSLCILIVISRKIKEKPNKRRLR